jgi:hypothetical protein
MRLIFDQIISQDRERLRTRYPLAVYKGGEIPVGYERIATAYIRLTSVDDYIQGALLVLANRVQEDERPQQP